MDKSERQARHQQRLERKRIRDEKMMEYHSYWIRFQNEAIRIILELPEPFPEHSFSIALFYRPSFRNPVHYRLDWGERSARHIQKIWLLEYDCQYFDNAPASPEDPRSPEDYWQGILPSVKEEEQMLSLDSIADLMKIVSELRIPVLPINPTCFICLDGDNFELTFTQGSYLTSIWKWHNNVQAGWEPLEEIIRLIQSLE